MSKREAFLKAQEFVTGTIFKIVSNPNLDGIDEDTAIQLISKFTEGALAADAMHSILIKEVETLIDKDPERGSPNGNRLELVSTVVSDYEKFRWPIGKEKP